MNKFFSSALVSALATVTLTASSAHAQNTFEDHEDLFRAIQEVGVTVAVNSKLHCSGENDGVYYPGIGLLVICQDNMVTHGKQELWTSNDLDTLRHEAHHVVQDCAAESLGDGLLSTLFSEDELVEFLKNSSVSFEGLQELYAMLDEQGLSDLVIQQEMEAYVVAEDVPAATISAKVRQFCF
tara:strand:+ start:320 stop:865 length:546 start_codon:yes stop_codon:yes gene_type:complete